MFDHSCCRTHIVVVHHLRINAEIIPIYFQHILSPVMLIIFSYTWSMTYMSSDWSVAGAPLSANKDPGRLLLLCVGSAGAQAWPRPLLRGDGPEHDQDHQVLPSPGVVLLPLSVFVSLLNAPLIVWNIQINADRLSVSAKHALMMSWMSEDTTKM